MSVRDCLPPLQQKNLGVMNLGREVRGAVEDRERVVDDPATCEPSQRDAVGSERP